MERSDVGGVSTQCDYSREHISREYTTDASTQQTRVHNSREYTERNTMGAGASTRQPQPWRIAGLGPKLGKAGASRLAKGYGGEDVLDARDAEEYLALVAGCGAWSALARLAPSREAAVEMGALDAALADAAGPSVGEAVGDVVGMREGVAVGTRAGGGVHEYAQHCTPLMLVAIEHVVALVPSPSATCCSPGRHVSRKGSPRSQ